MIPIERKITVTVGAQRNKSKGRVFFIGKDQMACIAAGIFQRFLTGISKAVAANLADKSCTSAQFRHDTGHVGRSTAGILLIMGSALFAGAARSKVDQNLTDADKIVHGKTPFHIW